MSAVNREAAEEWYARGSVAASSGDLNQALKCFRKSHDLFPDPKTAAVRPRLNSVRALTQPVSIAQNVFVCHALDASQKIKDIEQVAKNFASSSPNPPPKPKPVPAASPEPAAPSFTPEQAELVKKIKQTKEYYELLGLQKGADLAAITSAYRKLAVKLHPVRISCLRGGLCAGAVCPISSLASLSLV